MSTLFATLQDFDPDKQHLGQAHGESRKRKIMVTIIAYCETETAGDDQTILDDLTVVIPYVENEVQSILSDLFGARTTMQECSALELR